MDTEFIGLKFDRLTVISLGEPTEDRRKRWNCLCICGKIKAIREKCLKSGMTRSCGCLLEECRRTNRNKLQKTICAVCQQPFINKGGHRAKFCGHKCRLKDCTDRGHKYRRSDFQHVIKGSVRRVKTRALKMNIAFNIDFKYIWALFNKQEKRCAKTNMLLEISMDYGMSNRSPWGLSIDRINNKKGYIKGNIQIVTNMYNVCKNTWTHEQVLEFSKAVIKTK